MRKPASILAIALAISPVASSATVPVQGWEIGPDVRGVNYSQGMPLRPQIGPKGAVWFDFPPPGGEIDALTRRIAPLTGAKTITMRYRVDAAPGVRFVPSEVSGEKATVSLYFQQSGDNWTGKGRFASYRWYAPGGAVMPIVPGTHSVTIALRDVWTNVWGESNTAHAGAYADALEKTETLGIAFGSVGRRSHGVYATGRARFTLLSLDID
jgi:hypothetical protein